MNISEKITDIYTSLSGIVPESWLCMGFLLMIFADILFHVRKLEGSTLLWSLCLFVVLIEGYAIGQSWFFQSDGFLFEQSLFTDAKSLFFKALIIFSAMIMLLHIKASKQKFSGEFYAIFLAILLGLNLLTMATNLLIAYLAIEVISLGSYILTGIRGQQKSTEAALKYLLFGGMASATMLYGMSLLYGITGTLNIADVAFSRGLAQTDAMAVSIITLLTLAGLFFKMSLAPLHVWTPDVYQAAPTPVVSFFSIAPKAATLLFLLRLLEGIPAVMSHLLVVVALASIIIGNFSALWQTNIKRMLAYSGIAQMGFILIGWATYSRLGVQSSIFYITVYVCMNMAAFLLMDILTGFSDSPSLEDFKGLGKKQPLLGIALLVVMLSLVGLPPTAGFTAKLLLFSALWESYSQTANSVSLVLFVIGLLNTAIALVYYLKIPYFMFFKTSNETKTIKPTKTFLIVGMVTLLIFPIVWLFISPEQLLAWIGY